MINSLEKLEIVKDRGESAQILGACRRRLRRRGIPPAKIRKDGEAAPLKTAKEPGEKHRFEPHFVKENFFIFDSEFSFGFFLFEL